MRKSRRQIINRVIEATGLTLVALALLVFFAVYQPLGNSVSKEERRYSELRQTVRDQQARVEVLKRFEADMPETAKGLEDFLTNRIPPRREAFSVADHLVHKIGDAANVKILGVSFRLDSQHKDPLQRLQLEINVQGPYDGLMKFSHALETANNIIQVREFSVSPGTAGGLSMRMGADLYLTP